MKPGDRRDTDLIVLSKVQLPSWFSRHVSLSIVVRFISMEVSLPLRCTGEVKGGRSLGLEAVEAKTGQLWLLWETTGDTSSGAMPLSAAEDLLRSLALRCCGFSSSLSEDVRVSPPSFLGSGGCSSMVVVCSSSRHPISEMELLVWNRTELERVFFCGDVLS